MSANPPVSPPMSRTPQFWFAIAAGLALGAAGLFVGDLAHDAVRLPELKRMYTGYSDTGVTDEEIAAAQTSARFGVIGYVLAWVLALGVTLWRPHPYRAECVVLVVGFGVPGFCLGVLWIFWGLLFIKGVA